jgi:pimeloyl-ACP methyl ester carboxylesterase
VNAVPPDGNALSLICPNFLESTLSNNQRRTLPPAVTGERHSIESAAGSLSYYTAGPGEGADPLLLIHSINAAGSAYEVKPLYEHYRQSRVVYALELPGFGFSERGDRDYTPRLMTDAIHAMVTEIQRIHGVAPLDALSISLSSEFLARAALEDSNAFRSLALISPTGFNRNTPEQAPPGSTRAMPRFRKILSLCGSSFFSALTSKPSIRYFLRKTWGSKDIDEGLVEYDYLTTHQPGAHYAPYAFVSGFLFSLDIQSTYRALGLPIWMAHGVRGDFTDYTKAPLFASRPNWTIETFPTGAMPHFEMLDRVTRSYDAFRSGVAQRMARSISPAPSAIR